MMNKKEIKKQMTSVKDEIPDMGDSVLALCPKMGENGESILIVANITYDNEWYSHFPYDQPVKPTHWSYSLSIKDDLD